MIGWQERLVHYSDHAPIANERGRIVQMRVVVIYKPYDRRDRRQLLCEVKDILLVQPDKLFLGRFPTTSRRSLLPRRKKIKRRVACDSHLGKCNKISLCFDGFESVV